MPKLDLLWPQCQHILQTGVSQYYQILFIDRVSPVTACENQSYVGRYEVWFRTLFVFLCLLTVPGPGWAILCWWSYRLKPEWRHWVPSVVMCVSPGYRPAAAAAAASGARMLLLSQPKVAFIYQSWVLRVLTLPPHISSVQKCPQCPNGHTM